MPFDSQGHFTRVMNWTNDYENGIEIVCDRHDAEDDNFAEGFNDCFCRDGRAIATGNFKMGNFKITGLGDGTIATDAVNKGQLDSVNSTLTALIASSISTAISNIYPVGSVYIGIQATCPLATLIPDSTWELQDSGLVLQCSDSGHTAGTTISAGLPNITGSFLGGDAEHWGQTATGAFTDSEVLSTKFAGGNSALLQGKTFDASQSNSIYGNSTTVQPPALVVNVWIRTA